MSELPEIIPYLYSSTIKSEPIFYYLYGLASVGNIIPAFKFTHKPDGYCDVVFVSTLPYNLLVTFLMYKITTAKEGNTPISLGIMTKNKKHFIGFMKELVPYDVDSYTKEQLNDLVDYDNVTPRDLTPEEQKRYSTALGSANYALCKYDLNGIDIEEVTSDIKLDIKLDISKSKEKDTAPVKSSKTSRKTQVVDPESKAAPVKSSKTSRKTQVVAPESNDLCGAMTTKKTPCKLKKSTCRYHNKK